MAENRRAHTIVVGGVRVNGLASPVRSGELRRAIESGLGDQLAAAAKPDGAPKRMEIDRLKLRLVHKATSKDIAQALSQAIARSLRGERQ